MTEKSGFHVRSIISNVPDDRRIGVPCPEAVEIFVFTATFIPALGLTMPSSLEGISDSYFLKVKGAGAKHNPLFNTEILNEWMRRSPCSPIRHHNVVCNHA
jgi:hypothetical protein